MDGVPRPCCRNPAGQGADPRCGGHRDELCRTSRSGGATAGAVYKYPWPGPRDCRIGLRFRHLCRLWRGGPRNRMGQAGDPEGRRAAGEMTPLLLIPGMMCDARMWGGLPALLHPRPVAHCLPTKAETMADLAALILRDAPDRFALAGLSMGGIVAMEVLRQAPERVERLALLDTNPRAGVPGVPPPPRPPGRPRPVGPSGCRDPRRDEAELSGRWSRHAADP